MLINMCVLNLLQVASATSTFSMVFSSSMSVVQYYLIDRFPVPYGKDWNNKVSLWSKFWFKTNFVYKVFFYFTFTM